jgi:hypothetical protein
VPTPVPAPAVAPADRRIKAKMALAGITVAQFNARQAQFVQALAITAAVRPSNVRILSVKAANAVASAAPARRGLLAALRRFLAANDSVVVEFELTLETKDAQVDMLSAFSQDRNYHQNFAASVHLTLMDEDAAFWQSKTPAIVPNSVVNPTYRDDSDLLAETGGGSAGFPAGVAVGVAAAVVFAAAMVYVQRKRQIQGKMDVVHNSKAPNDPTNPTNPTGNKAMAASMSFHSNPLAKHGREPSLQLTESHMFGGAAGSAAL